MSLSKGKLWAFFSLFFKVTRLLFLRPIRRLYLHTDPARLRRRQAPRRSLESSSSYNPIALRSRRKTSSCDNSYWPVAFRPRLVSCRVVAMHHLAPFDQPHLCSWSGNVSSLATAASGFSIITHQSPVANLGKSEIKSRLSNLSPILHHGNGAK